MRWRLNYFMLRICYIFFLNRYFISAYVISLFRHNRPSLRLSTIFFLEFSTLISFENICCAGSNTSGFIADIAYNCHIIRHSDRPAKVTIFVRIGCDQFFNLAPCICASRIPFENIRCAGFISNVLIRPLPY